MKYTIAFFVSVLAFGFGLALPQYSYAATTYTVDLLAPSAGSAFQEDEFVKIMWNRGEGDASFVTLSFSDDGGATWQEIVRNTVNDGSHSWVVPHIQSDDVWVRIATTDLATELASDVVGPLSVTFYAEDNAEYWSDRGGPYETIPEDIDGLISGDFLSLEGSDEVYMVGEDMTRRPFYNHETLATYIDSSDEVVEVSLNTFGKFDVGDAVLPKAGVVLVKTPSVNKVYWAEEVEGENPVLHWIVNEDIAEEMFGEEWNSYVLDVDSTLFSRYGMGDDIAEAFDVDPSSLKRVGDLW